MKNTELKKIEIGAPQTSEDIIPVSTWVYDKKTQRSDRQQFIIREKPITLYLNGDEVVTLLCTGRHLDELAAGFFYAEGFLQTTDDLKQIQVDETEDKVMVSIKTDPSLAEKLWQKRTITSGCGKGTLFYSAMDALLSKPVESSLKISPDAVSERMRDLNGMSNKYRQTHGVHNTALATPSEILVFRDDIGRHNAVDMIVGHAFLKNIPLKDKLLITTGRLTSEIVIKTAKIGIPFIASRNTATTLAVQIAKSLGITLVGYVRAGKLTVYSGNERIESPPPVPAET